VTKVCTKCKIDTPLEKMGKSRTSKDGYNIYCKECLRTASQAWRDLNPDKNKESQANYAARNRPKISAKQLDRYYLKRDEILQQMRSRRDSDLQHVLEIERASRLRNKEKNRASKNARQSVRNRALCDTKFIILDKELKKIYSSPCAFCGSTTNQSLDHIIPLSKGGRHSVGNLMTLCSTCNASKGNKFYMQWKLTKLKNRA
jgi:5-methylcytosine-specific restriction endonuclease McrA